MKIIKNKNIIQITKFTFFSLSAGIIQIVTDALLVELLSFPPQLAYLTSLILSILWNYTLNRKFTFKAANNVPIAMLKIFLFYLIFTPLSTLWTYYFVTILKFNNYLILAITMIINFILEFIYQKFYVFKK